MKKLICVFLALLLTLSLMPALSAEEPALEVNLIKSGGFESESGIKLSQNAILTADERKNGNKSAKLEAADGDSFISLEVSGIVGGATYQATLWFKSQVGDRGSFCLEVEEYCNNRSSFDCHVITHSSPEQKNMSNWTKLVYNFKPQLNTSLIVLKPMLKAEGTAYADDIELKMTALPEKLSFKLATDNIFYYTEYAEGNGQAVATLDTAFKAEGYTADFRFMDGAKELLSKKGVAFANNKAKFDYPLTLLSQKGKEYKIEADIKDATGTIFKKLEQKIYKYDHPKGLSLDGRVFTDLNGKQVRPIVMYHIGKDDWESAASAGINVVQYSAPSNVDATLRELDRMYKLGVYAALVCYWGMKPAGHPDNIDRVRDFVEKVKHHPAIFCYMVMDEPFINNPYAHDNLRESYRMLREADPYRPIYICEGFAEYYEEVEKVCDIIAPDPYPGAWNHYGTFTADTLKKVVDRTEGTGKMVLPIMQAFTYASNPVPESTPTEVQLHAFIYQAYLAGTDGLGWYTWTPDNYDYDKMLDEGKYWPILQNYHNVEADILYPYFVEEKYQTFIKGRDSKYWYDLWIVDDHLYAAIQNRTELNQDFEIPLISENGLVNIGKSKVELISTVGNPEFTAQEDKVIAKLEPYQAALIKITPDNVPDYSQLSKSGDTQGYDWAEDAINFMYDSGIADKETEGYSFRPGDNITRGEFAMYLIRTLGLDSIAAADNFADVDEKAIYANEVAIGKTLGVLNGVGEGRYMPDEGISRQDLMVICVRAMRYVNAVNADNSDLSAYPDGAAVADYARKSVAAMLDIGIIKGNADGTINPQGNTTRAEAAVIMQRIYDWKTK